MNFSAKPLACAGESARPVFARGDCRRPSSTTTALQHAISKSQAPLTRTMRMYNRGACMLLIHSVDFWFHGRVYIRRLMLAPCFAGESTASPAASRIVAVLMRSPNKTVYPRILPILGMAAALWGAVTKRRRWPAVLAATGKHHSASRRRMQAIGLWECGSIVI